MIFRLLLFVITFLLLLGGAHVAVYFSVIPFFSISSPSFKLYLVLFLGFMFVSFFLSTLLLRLHGNVIWNYYYTLSATWLGIMINFLMGSVVLWLCWLAAKGFGFELNLFYPAGIVFVLCLFFSAFGAWNAFHPVVKTISPVIENLPDQWKNKTVIQLSDVHLGPIHRVGFLNRLVELTNAQKPDLILITGDLFDGMDGSLDPFIEPLSRFKAAEGVYFVTGNHEGYLGINESLSILKKTPIKILDNEIADVDGLQIVGISYPLFSNENHPEKLFKSANYKPEKPTILLYHTPTNLLIQNDHFESQQWNTYLKPDTNFTFARENGVNLQLSGHTHAGQLFPFNWIASLIFKKYSYGLHKEGPFNIYTSSGAGTWGPPMRTFSRSEIVKIKLK